jgi:hypothetical protein
MNRDLKRKIFLDIIEALSLRNVEIMKLTNRSSSQIANYKGNPKVSVPEPFILELAKKVNYDISKYIDFSEPINNELKEDPIPQQKMSDSERLDYLLEINRLKNKIIALQEDKLRDSEDGRTGAPDMN